MEIEEKKKEDPNFAPMKNIIEEIEINSHTEEVPVSPEKLTESQNDE